jgi:hypothetical protein
MPKKLKKIEPTARFMMAVGSFEIRGEKYVDGWRWYCPQLPFISRDFDGSDTTVGAVEAFMQRALKPVHEMKRAMIEIG